MISVIIPTLNSAKTIPLAVASSKRIAKEVIVVDSFSTDGTDKIAEENGAIVIKIKGSRLRARIEGAKVASGDYVINLDADMYFAREFSIPENEIIALGEITVGKGFVAKLMKIDREITHKHWRENLSLDGGIIPRMYRRDVLLKAYSAIPENLHHLQAFEDSLIYYFALKACDCKEVGYVPDVIYHIEDDSLITFMRKWYKYGKNAKLLKNSEYRFLISRRRKGLKIDEKVKVFPIMLLKGLPFLLGYLF